MHICSEVKCYIKHVKTNKKYSKPTSTSGKTTSSKEAFDDTWRERLGNYRHTKKFKKNLKKLNELIEPPKSPRTKSVKKLLILFMGIPGSGKSTISKIVNEKCPCVILQSDAIYFTVLRDQIWDDYYKAYVYTEELAKKFLGKGYSVIIDDNCRTLYNRSKYYELAKNHDAKPVLINIAISTEIGVKREIVKGNQQPRSERIRSLNIAQKQLQQPTEKESQAIKIINVDGEDPLKNIKKEVVSELQNI